MTTFSIHVMPACQVSVDQPTSSQLLRLASIRRCVVWLLAACQCNSQSVWAHQVAQWAHWGCCCWQYQECWRCHTLLVQIQTTSFGLLVNCTLVLKKFKLYIPSFTHAHTHTHTHTHTHNRFMALWIFSGTTRVSQYQKKHSLTPIVIISHLLSASAIYYNPWYPPCSIYVPDSFFSTISVRVFFGLPLGLASSTSYSIHFFTQSLSSFCSIFRMIPIHLFYMVDCWWVLMKLEINMMWFL